MECQEISGTIESHNPGIHGVRHENASLLVGADVGGIIQLPRAGAALAEAATCRPLRS